MTSAFNTMKRTLASVHFNACSVRGRPTMMELGFAMMQRSTRRRRSDGHPVPDERCTPQQRTWAPALRRELLLRGHDPSGDDERVVMVGRLLEAIGAFE